MPQLPAPKAALLKLRNGSQFVGRLVFPCQPCVGELVFNTAMSGYQEIITDPSYSHQIVTFTYPHIGNTGINPQDYESIAPHVSGIVVRCPELQPCNYRATAGLYDWLKHRQVPALGWVDTRAITHLLRNKGALDAAIVQLQGEGDTAMRRASGQADELLQGFAGLAGQDLTNQPGKAGHTWNQGRWDGHDYPKLDNVGQPLVVVLDFGVKHNILRMLAAQRLRVQQVSATTSAADILALRPAGVLLANGPGDPAAVGCALHTIGELLASGVPLFGICLGMQLLALALGGTTSKMKFGHHGANHPVQELASGRVFITSQNHGFMVDADSLGEQAEPTHHSLFDGSLQGFALRNRPVYAFQGHPEASPGPQDMAGLFNNFARQVCSHAKT